MYKINDTVSFSRHRVTYTGTVTKGPFKVPGEKLEHYHVKWNHQEYETIEPLVSTQKYKYELI